VSPNYPAAFLLAVERVLMSEGGYVNDANDVGGETHWGVSKRAYPALDIRALTRDDAIAIYWRDYWTAVRGSNLPFPVAIVVFDAAVNQGVKTAIRFLQSALKVLEDGVIGPATIAAAEASSDPVDLAGRVCRRRVISYSTLEGWERYRTSWVQRTFDVYRVAIEARPA